jgi:glutamate synthase (NADPH) large chain
MVVSGSDVSEHHPGGLALVADRHGRARREIVERGLEALGRLAHRGSIGAHGPWVNAAGILTTIPWDLFAPELPPPLADPGAHRVAATFALDPQQADRAVAAAQWALRRLGWHVMAWRDVPTCLNALAPERRAAAPRIAQCFACASRPRQKRTPYRTRMAIEARWLRLGLTRCSVTSFSDSTIAYKGLVDPSALPSLFPDLAAPDFTSPFAVLHHGVSVNTPPRWDLAQPFHAIAHNGEITTIAGNRQWMHVRISDAGIRDEADVVKAGGSDSQTLDAAVQWLCETGLSTPHALTRLLPPVWEDDDRLPPEVRAFHRHEACFAEPWDGASTIAFADGRFVGAIQGRNELRRCYTAETGDLVCLASEPGLFELSAGAATTQGCLGAGEMLMLDLAAGIVLQGEGASRGLAAQHDYAAMADRLIHRVRDTRCVSGVRAHDEVERLHRVFSWTREELEVSARPIAAQTREAPITSLRTLLGRRGQWMSQALAPVLLELDSPVLLDEELAAVLDQNAVRAAVLPIGFDASGDSASHDEALRNGLARLRTMATALAANGTRILVLSDRLLASGVTPIPALLATDAVDRGLRASRLRLRASVIVESGEVRDAHQTAALCSVGASAVVPYLLYATAQQITGEPQAAERCRRALECALRNILSKTGVYSIEAYTGARLFYADRDATEPSAEAAPALA